MKLLLRFGAICAICAGVAVFAVTLAHAVWYAPESAAASTESSLTKDIHAPASEPVRLIIPRLGINARVQHVGLGKGGAMGVPSNFTDVAWYQGGTLPGHTGSAVMDGHVDNGLGLDGVFKRLSDIRRGDSVEVITQDGTKLSFVVSDIETYPYRDVPLGKVFDANDQPRLNLITCEGAWVAGGDTYDHRIVVYTTLTSV